MASHLLRRARAPVASALRRPATSSSSSSAISSAISARPVSLCTSVPRRALSTKYDTTDNEWELAKTSDNDTNRRAFSYFVLGSARFMYASAVRLAAIRLISTMSASADVLALSSIEVDLNKISSGSTITVKWRGKPVFIRRRTEKEVTEAETTPLAGMVDPEPDAKRVQNPEWLGVIGVCTHLGCVPISNAGDYNGWFCPCHGSHYDVSGRIRKGPAPLNLEVPMYSFIEGGKKLRVG